MNFGKINRYLFLGGGLPLAHAATLLANKGRDVLLATTPRYVQEEFVNLDSGPVLLVDWLKSSGVDLHVCLDANFDERINEFITKETLGISGGLAWIFDKTFLSRFSGRLVSLHGHRLPFNRGGLAGYSWDVMDHQSTGGCTIHLISPGLNTGDIVAKAEFLYPDWCKKPTDYQTFAISKGTSLLTEFLGHIDVGKEFQLANQIDHESRYWPQLNTKANGFIDWTWTLDQIESFIRAFDDPYIGASTFINGQRVYFKDSSTFHKDGNFHPFKTGIIYRKIEGKLFIATGDGGLVIETIADENGTSILPAMRLGDRFYTPRHILDEAMQYRPIYTSEGVKASRAQHRS